MSDPLESIEMVLKGELKPPPTLKQLEWMIEEIKICRKTIEDIQSSIYRMINEQAYLNRWYDDQ